MTSQYRIDTAPQAGTTAALPQIAALCWRRHGKGRQILLVTSRDTGRWVIPKGWPMEGLTSDQAAAREAWEEAGVEGRIEGTAIGIYTYDKQRRDLSVVLCAVEVFPLRVERMLHRFPERAERRRKWFDAEKAARKVAEPDLRALILGFAAGEGEDDTGGSTG